MNTISDLSLGIVGFFLALDGYCSRSFLLLKLALGSLLAGEALVSSGTRLRILRPRDVTV